MDRPSSTAPARGERRAALSLFRPHRWAFARASLLALGLLAGQLLALSALGPLFSGLADGHALSEILRSWKTGGALLGALWFMGLLRWRLPTVQAQAEEAFVSDLQGQVLGGLLALPSSFWARASVGDLSLRLTDDIRALLAYARALYQSIWLVPLRIAGLFALLWWMAPAIAVPALVAVPLVALALVVMGRGLSDAAQEGRAARASHAGALSRILVSAELLQACDARRQMVSELNEQLHRVFVQGARLSRLSNLGVQFADLLRLVGIVGVLLWGQRAVRVGALSWADLLASVPILFLLYGPVVELVRLAPRMAEGRVGIRGILPLLALAEEKGGGKIHFSKELVLQGIGFSYDTRQAVLEEASMRIHPGEWVALVGPSGAGKSTLLKLLLGLERPLAGRILLDGHDVTASAHARVRPLCALVTQDPILPERTVRGNLLLVAPRASEEALWNSLEAAALAGRVRSDPKGLDLDVGERGTALSGGERERLALARALLSPAPILLLDEPTTFLDPPTRNRLVGQLARERGRRTLIVVSHEPELVAAADRLYRLCEGRLEEEPRPQSPKLRSRGG